MKTKVYLLSLVSFREKFPELTKREIEKTAGDYAVRTVFSDLFGYDNVEIICDKKPYIKNCPYYFNLSHSGDFLLLAVGDTPVGADIEKITKIHPKTLEKCFSKEEQSYVEKVGTDAFFEIWTKKESLLKCMGEGFHRRAKSVNVIDNFYADDNIYYFKVWRVSEYMISVCSRKDEFAESIEFIEL